MFERLYTVEEVDARERLDRFLERRLDGVSRGRIRTAILAGEVTVNGVQRESGRRLRAGDRVTLAMGSEPVRALRPEAIPLSVLFEDEELLVVDKPAEMFAHPTSRVHSGTLLNAAIHHVAQTAPPGAHVRPLLVHRLDRATSGALVLSKTPRAHNRLARAWNERRVAKRYVALACGRMPEGSGLVDAPIGGSREHTPGFRVMEGGRPAQTRYRELGRYGPFALLELEPLTGRTNQLRIHCAHAGAPIAGDDLHGLPEIAAFERLHPAAPAPGRLFLHAAGLQFRHPSTNAPLRIESPLPRELEAFLARLEALYGV